jgi:ribonuclease D
MPMPFEQLARDVTSSHELSTAVGHMDDAVTLAVDVEADSMHHFRERLCFVQLGTDSHIALVDTLQPDIDYAPLRRLLQNPAVKFFHAAQGDLSFLAELDLRVTNLFDTHRAATLLNWPKVGLADLVFEKLGVTLKKEHQQADFSLRPLAGELREYIADDVRFLTEVGRTVRQACADTDILEEVELDCQRMVDEAVPRAEAFNSYSFKLPKSKMSTESQQVARALAAWLHQQRLQWAEAADVPMGRMLSNTALTEIAVAQPDDVKSLSRLKGVRGQVARDFGDSILQEIVQLREAANRGELPALPDRPVNDAKRKKREEALIAFRKEAAAARKVTPLVILPNAIVQTLSSHPPESVQALNATPYFGAKRGQLYGEQLFKLLDELR